MGKKEGRRLIKGVGKRRGKEINGERELGKEGGRRLIEKGSWEKER